MVGIWLKTLSLNLLVVHMFDLRWQNRRFTLSLLLRTRSVITMRRSLIRLVFENIRGQSLTYLFLTHFILEEEIGHILALKFELTTRVVCSLTYVLNTILSGRLWYTPPR